MKKLLLSIIAAITLCGAVVAQETEAEKLYREINEFTQQILQRSARLKELADTPCPIPDPCPDCPACPDCPDCPDCDDDDDDPPPPPPPPVEGVYPLTINGKPWTFQTPPPANLSIVSHPRLILPGRTEELRRRLTSPVYAESVKLAKYRAGTPLWAAFQYALYGKATDAATAKEWLLGLESKIVDDNESGNVYWEIVAYDWCHDIFTAAEREQIFTTIAMRLGITEVVAGSDQFTIYPKWPHPTKDDGFSPDQWFGNDLHDPSQAFGVIWRGVLALAFHGDGVRDEWCEYVFQRMLDGGDSRIYPIYHPKGGMVDSHNQRALDSGGIQSAWNHDAVMDGYENYFSTYLPQFMVAWETATGDDLFTDDNYFRLMPHRVAYRWHKGLKLASNARLVSAMQMMTGIYADIDPEMAGLARHLCEAAGDRGNYFQFPQFLLSNEDIPAKSPAEISYMPLGKTLRGDDICHSRSSWESDATCVQMFIRTIDTHRYEPNVGGLYIARGGKPLIMRGNGRKGSMRSSWVANTLIWPTEFRPEVWGQGESYWGGQHLRGPFALKPWVDRATSVIDSVTLPSYRGPVPTEDHGTDAYHVFAVDSMELRTGINDKGEFERLDVGKAKRTIVHLRPDENGREFVLVYDRLSVAADLSHCWQARFLNKPDATSTAWTAENDGQALHGTVLTPGMSVEVRGGIPKCTEGPNGELYGVIDKLFHDDGSSGTPEIYGEYAIYIKPDVIKQQQDYCVVLEVGDTGFAPAAATMTGKVVSVGGWLVDFGTEDQTEVSR